MISAETHLLQGDAFEGQVGEEDTWVLGQRQEAEASKGCGWQDQEGKVSGHHPRMA